MSETSYEVAWGLDLAGYSTSKSGLARAERESDKTVKFTVYQHHPFAVRYEGKHRIMGGISTDRETIEKCSPLYVDIPIDLQGLPDVPSPTFAWQLTKRPVDFAFGAMPPLADRIGSPVVRFRAAVGKKPKRLGAGVFETYPSQSLANWLDDVPSYKNQDAKFRKGCWLEDGDSSDKENGLSKLLTACGFTATDGITLNDDHFDACICALVGVLEADDVLRGEELNETVGAKLRESPKVRKQDLRLLDFEKLNAPKGYEVIRGKLEGWTFIVEVSDILPGWYEDHEQPS